VSVPYDEIEAGIRPIVRVLNEAGIKTFASCEGHGDDGWAWINCEVSDDYGIEDIVSALINNSIVGFSVSEVWVVRNKTPVLKSSNINFHHWSISFWKPL